MNEYVAPSPVDAARSCRSLRDRVFTTKVYTKSRIYWDKLRSKSRSKYDRQANFKDQGRGPPPPALPPAPPPTEPPVEAEENPFN